MGVIPKYHLVVRCIVQAVSIGIKHFLLQYKTKIINAELLVEKIKKVNVRYLNDQFDGANYFKKLNLGKKNKKNLGSTFFKSKF